MTINRLPPGLTRSKSGIFDEEHAKKWFVGSIDQGTTSTRFLIFNSSGEPVASHQIEFRNLHPQSG